VKNIVGDWRERYLVLLDGMLLVFSSRVPTLSCVLTLILIRVIRPPNPNLSPNPHPKP
jgi:hypothetical protein